MFPLLEVCEPSIDAPIIEAFTPPKIPAKSAEPATRGDDKLILATRAITILLIAFIFFYPFLLIKMLMQLTE
jgi:hypothetical protein